MLAKDDGAPRKAAAWQPRSGFWNFPEDQRLGEGVRKVSRHFNCTLRHQLFDLEHLENIPIPGMKGEKFCSATQQKTINLTIDRLAKLVSLAQGMRSTFSISSIDSMKEAISHGSY